jgi:hypothetical protein
MLAPIHAVDTRHTVSFPTGLMDSLGGEGRWSPYTRELLKLHSHPKQQEREGEIHQHVEDGEIG